MLDRPLWPVGQGLTSKRLGNNLKVVRLGNRIEEGLSKVVKSFIKCVRDNFKREKDAFAISWIELVISNDLLRYVVYDLGEFID